MGYTSVSICANCESSFYIELNQVINNGSIIASNILCPNCNYKVESISLFKKGTHLLMTAVERHIRTDGKLVFSYCLRGYESDKETTSYPDTLIIPPIQLQDISLEDSSKAAEYIMSCNDQLINSENIFSIIDIDKIKNEPLKKKKIWLDFD